LVYIIIIEGVPTNKDYIKFSKELLKSRENIEKKLGKPVYLDTADQIKGEYAANKANKVFYLNALRPISDITTPTKHGSYNLWK
jgi:hypothetical protein